MTTFTSRTFLEGDEEAVFLPDEVSFGADVDVVLTRVGDVISMRRLDVSVDQTLTAVLED